MRLRDLNPGDEFEYVNTIPEYRKGQFIVLDTNGGYLRPASTETSRFLFSYAAKKVVNHFVGQEVIIKKEANVRPQKQMGHFIGWEFGVPVKISGMHSGSVCIDNEKALLVFENDLNFRVINPNGSFSSYHKSLFYYKLVPYNGKHASYPVYPVCRREDGVSPYLNGSLRTFAGVSDTLQPAPTAKLVLEDGTKIELSAETIANLKEQLGV